MSTRLTLETVLASRLYRQGLTHPAQTEAEYLRLFARLQPVLPVYNTRPGDPPRLWARVAFDDGPVADKLRARRGLVKGRFAGGGLAYVLTEDLALYAQAFRRPLDGMTHAQAQVYEVLNRMGPLTPRQIKAETGLLSKFVAPALQRLQEAFLVYEDQVDNDWERGWYDFAAEWPDIRLAEGPTEWEVAAGEVLGRFLAAQAFASFEQLKDWSGWASKALTGLITRLERENKLVADRVEGLGEGWRLAEDSFEAARLSRSVFMLHRADFLVRAQATALKKRYAGQEVLQYILIDGQFQGAVLGHWRIGPHDVDDILLELPAAEREERRPEILKAVAEVYQPPFSHILKYGGEPV